MTGRRTIEPRPIGDVLQLPRRVRPWYFLATAAGVALLIAVSSVLVPPSSVSQITVRNPTRYDLSIEVAGGEADGWMALGSARRDTTTTFREVLDQGDMWVVQLSAQGEDGGIVRISKADLERANWQIDIPASVSDTLQAKGAEFPP